MRDGRVEVGPALSPLGPLVDEMILICFLLSPAWLASFFVPAPRAVAPLEAHCAGLRHPASPRSCSTLPEIQLWRRMAVLVSPDQSEAEIPACPLHDRSPQRSDPGTWAP